MLNSNLNFVVDQNSYMNEINYDLIIKILKINVFFLLM